MRGVPSGWLEKTRLKHAPPLWAYASLAGSMALVGSYVGLSKLLVARLA